MTQEHPERRGYGKIYRRLWRHRDFRGFTDREKVLTFYLLTGPQTNRVGLFAFSLATAADTLGWSIESFRARFSKVIHAFQWFYDDKARVCFLPSWWEWNPLTRNPDNLKGYLSDLNDVPRTALIHKFCNNLQHVPENQHGLIQAWESVLSPIATALPSWGGTAGPKELNGTTTEKNSLGAAPHGDRASSEEGQQIHAFLKGFCDVWRKHHEGAKYVIKGERHVPIARNLLKTHPVARLLRLATVLQLVKHDPYITESDRGIEIFSARINWLEARLAEAEAQKHAG